MKHESIPTWQLPDGVSAGTWDYAHKDSIADQYDEYFADHPLFALDQQLVLGHLPPAAADRIATVVDLGCGTGRALQALAASGYHGLAIDLSQRMLQQVEMKRRREALNIVSVRANLVQLEGLQDECVDHAVSLFSTLGMIRGRANRVTSLHHVNRIMRRGGLFVLHVHNIWSALMDPAGPRWLLQTLWASRKADVDFGDRIYNYRGLPNMFLHNFGLRELKHDLTSSGFEISSIFPLNHTASEVLRWPKVLPRLRAGGFIAVCQKKDLSGSSKSPSPQPSPHNLRRQHS